MWLSSWASRHSLWWGSGEEVTEAYPTAAVASLSASLTRRRLAKMTQGCHLLRDTAELNEPVL